MAKQGRAFWLLGHAACALLAVATWRVASPVTSAHAAPPSARWRIEERSHDRLLVRDLLGGGTRIAPNPVPRLCPMSLAPGFNPNYWAIADANRVKVISLQTGEAVVNFEAPCVGVDRLVWLDEDRLAVVAKGDRDWLVHRVSTGRQIRR